MLVEQSQFHFSWLDHVSSTLVGQIYNVCLLNHVDSACELLKYIQIYGKSIEKCGHTRLLTPDIEEIVDFDPSP